MKVENSMENLKAVKAWLGEPISMDPHTYALFRCQSRSNLIIVGQDEKAATAMLLISVISLVSQQSPSQASFYFLNLSNVDAAWHDLPEQLADSMPHEINVGKRRDDADLMVYIANEVGQRSQNDEDTIESSLYLIILGLQRAKNLRSVDEYEPSPAAQNLALILRDGPDLRVHTLLWCDTLASFERVLERRFMYEFDMRVAMQMSEDDSTSFITTSSANKLGHHRAFYYDEERAGQLEKFRPYALPGARFIQEIGAKLTEKSK